MQLGLVNIKKDNFPWIECADLHCYLSPYGPSCACDENYFIPQEFFYLSKINIYSLPPYEIFNTYVLKAFKVYIRFMEIINPGNNLNCPNPCSLGCFIKILEELVV